MKRNKKLRLQIVLLSLACVLLAVDGLFFMPKILKFSWDLNLRRNEIICAHDGIDSFDIFDRKVSSEQFCGWPRPDKPNETKGNREYVHAYPPWHTAVFWWYGSVSKNACIIIMLGIYLCLFIWICQWTFNKMQYSDAEHCISDVLFFFFFIMYSFDYFFLTLNYGILLLGCSCLLYNALEKKNEILAGIAFSLLMIKPQIGALFMIPLVINRNYKTIVIAGLLCVLETLFTAWKLDKSPVELILQIPKIGAPYFKGYIAQMFIDVIGPVGQYVSMAICAAIVSAGCFFLRNAKDVMVRFLPAIAFVPFWTYSQNHDWLFVLPCYIYIINNRQKWPRLYDLCFWLAILRALVLSAHSHHCYSLGKLGIAYFSFLVVTSISCFMALLNENDKWDYRSVMLKLKTLGKGNG